MEIPAEIAIEATLRQGAVYYMTWDGDGFSSTEPHYFVVLNVSPEPEKPILVVCAVSDIEKTKKRTKYLGFSEDTLVIVTPSDCPFLTHDSVFDCNFAKRTEMEKLVSKLRKGEIRKLSADVTISDQVIKRLVEATCKSTLIAEEDKNLLMEIK